MAMARVATTGDLTDTTGRTSETPVMIPPTITYGLQDTHTTILPTVFWFSAVNLSTTLPLTLKLRLNSFNDIICGTTNIKNAISTAGERVFIQHKVANTDITTTVTDTTMDTWNQFPATIGNDDDPEVWYRDYYKNIYQYYTVLGVEYEITYINPRDNGRHCLVAHTVETSGLGGATFLPETTSLKDLYGMKQIQFTNVQSRHTETDSEFQIIKGTYKPGSAKRDVSNDGDVKLWTTTTADATPSYVEALQLMHFAHPLSHNATSLTSTNGYQLMCQVRLKYIVQFKQLKQGVRYPTSVPLASTAGEASFPNSANPYIAP